MYITKEQLARIKEAANYAKCEGASFHAFPNKYKVVSIPETAVSDWIKQQIELHHSTWIVNPLIEIILEIEKQNNPELKR